MSPPFDRLKSMEITGKFVSESAVKWALSELKKIPKNQLALIFALIVSKCPEISYPKGSPKGPFELEMGRYLDAPIDQTKDSVFNPIEGDWRARDYIQSTVYGRLLNGSHSWTSPEVGYFERTPKSGWPAKIVFSQQGYDRLFIRTSPPCLKSEYRLPVLAIAIYYYRQIDLANLDVDSPQSLVDLYSKDVISTNPNLVKLFDFELPVFWGELFNPLAMTRQQYISCYNGAASKAQTKLAFDKELIDSIHARLKQGDSIENFITRAITKEMSANDNT